MPITETAWSRWSTTPSSVFRSGPIAIGVQHHAEEAPGVREGAELVVVQVPGGLVDGAAAAVGAEHRRAGDPLDDLGEDSGRSVREVEDDPERDEPVDELPPEAREAAAVLGSAVRERVAPVPREPGHPHAERVEHVGGPRLDPEALHTLERKHQPQAVAGSDRVEIGGARHLDDAVGVLGDRAVERGNHGERLAECALGLDDDVDVYRADLEPDTTPLEQRQPRLREHPGLAEPSLAVGELHQQVDVRVRDHGPRP